MSFDSEGPIAKSLVWLLKKLDQKGVQYCILRNHNRIPHDLIGNDVDILVANRDNEIVSSVVELCAETFGWILYRKTKIYFILSQFNGSKWTHLNLDFVNNLQARGFVYLPGEIFLEARQQRDDGIYVLSPTFEFAHLLVHALFGPVYNQHRYLSTLSRKLKESRVEMVQVERLLSMVFHFQCVNRIVTSLKEGDVVSILQDRNSFWIDYLRKSGLWQVWLRCEVGRWVDRVRRIIQPSGLFVVLLGPDGVGKSTIASLVTSLLQTARSAQHAHLGFRPGILPTKRELGLHKVKEQPLQTGSSGHQIFETPSIVRLLYNTLDYLLGYYLKIWPFLVRGGVLIGERYYYDYLVILPRKVAGAPGWMTRILFHLIPKPDVLILLKGDSATIRERRDELEALEIERQMTEFEAVGHTAKVHFLKIDTHNSPAKIAMEIVTVLRELRSR